MAVSGKAVEGATEFVQEACTFVEALGKSYVPSVIHSVQSDVQDLKSYFSRPRLISRGTIAFGTRGNVLQGNYSPNFIFSGLFPNGITRMTGVYGVRFSLKFKLQIACTPFHQGLLALCWQYYSPGANVFSRNSRPEACTNIPHVRLDLSESTMVELKVPFMNVREFIQLDDTVNAYGGVGINTLVAVPSVAGISPPSYELYVTLEDLEFIGIEPAAVTSTVVNSGRKVVEHEVEEEGRPLTRAVKSASSSVRFLARGIPALSSIAAPTAWFLDGVAGAFSAWGWSKPINLDPINRVLPMNHVAECNVDNALCCNNLSLFSDNHLRVDPSFAATDIDEMALGYVMGQYSQINLATIGVANTHGQIIWGMHVTPSHMWFRIPTAAPYGNICPPFSANTASGNSFFPSHQFFWAQMFRYWRGGFRFRFTFVKTKHHGGRVMFAYNPGLVTNQTLTSAVNINTPEISSSLIQPFGQSKIFDLRDGAQFEVDIHYTAPTPFLTFPSWMGDASLAIIDPLQCPAVVSQSIQVLVEVKALPGFELACPAGLYYPPHPAGTVLANSGRTVVEAAPSIGAAAADLCIGERVNSVKQLIMVPIVSKGQVAASTTDSRYVLPWFSYTIPSATAPLPITTSFGLISGYAGAAATSYLWARGSTEIHMYTPTNNFVTMNVAHSRNDTFLAPTTAVTTNSGSRAYVANLPRMLSFNGNIHVRVPPYHPTARIPASLFGAINYDLVLGSANGNVTPTSDFLTVLPRIIIQNDNTSPVTVYVSRAAGDDAMFGHYMGPVPLAVVQSTNTATLDANYGSTAGVPQ